MWIYHIFKWNPFDLFPTIPTCPWWTSQPNHYPQYLRQTTISPQKEQSMQQTSNMNFDITFKLPLNYVALPIFIYSLYPILPNHNALSIVYPSWVLTRSNMNHCLCNVLIIVSAKLPQHWHWLDNKMCC